MHKNPKPFDRLLLNFGSYVFLHIEGLYTIHVVVAIIIVAIIGGRRNGGMFQYKFDFLRMIDLHQTL